MKKFLLVCLLVTTAGCTDATLSGLGSYGSEFRVSIYSGGKVAKEYISTGIVHTEKDSDGWYFKDKKTDKFVRVSGTITVEQL